jgi:hypothetical protein
MEVWQAFAHPLRRGFGLPNGAVARTGWCTTSAGVSAPVVALPVALCCHFITTTTSLPGFMGTSWKEQVMSTTVEGCRKHKKEHTHSNMKMLLGFIGQYERSRWRAGNSRARRQCRSSN